MPSRPSLTDARRNIDHSYAVGATSAEGGAEESQRPAKTRLARPDCVVERRGAGYWRDHAPDRDLEAVRLALAGALYERGRRRAFAGQDAQARPGAYEPGVGQTCRCPDAKCSPKRNDPF